MITALIVLKFGIVIDEGIRISCFMSNRLLDFISIAKDENNVQS